MARRPPGEKVCGPRDPWTLGSSVDQYLQVCTQQLDTITVKISWRLPYGGARSIKLYIYHGNKSEYESQVYGDEGDTTLINFVPGKLYTATVEAQYNYGRRVTGSKDIRTTSY